MQANTYLSRDAADLRALLPLSHYTFRHYRLSQSSATLARIRSCLSSNPLSSSIANYAIALPLLQRTQSTGEQSELQNCLEERPMRPRCFELWSTLSSVQSWRSCRSPNLIPNKPLHVTMHDAGVSLACWYSLGITQQSG